MQRPRIACQRAVQSLNPPSSQYIWISDEVLAIAIRRFSRIQCIHQKRHGSHVPGPLEARRRAVKRQMTVQANLPTVGSLPMLLRLGDLFASRPSPHTSWKYEPPSFPPPELEDTASSRPPPIWKNYTHSAPDVAIEDFSRSPLRTELAVDPPDIAAVEHEIAIGHSIQVPLDPQQSKQKAALEKEGRIDVPKAEGGQSALDKHGIEVHSYRDDVINNSTEVISRDGKKAVGAKKQQSFNWTASVQLAQDLIESTDVENQRLCHEKLAYFTLKHYPTGRGADKFTLQVFKMLAKAKWKSNVILYWLGQVNVPLPLLHTREGARFQHRIDRMAAEVSTQSALIAPVCTKMAMAMQKGAVDPDVLRTLFRLLWECYGSGESSHTGLLCEIGQQLLISQRIPPSLVSRKEYREPTVQDINDVVKMHRTSTQGLDSLGQLFDCFPRRILREWVLSLPENSLKTPKGPVSSSVASHQDMDVWLRSLYQSTAESSNNIGNAAFVKAADKHKATYDIPHSVTLTILRALKARRQFRNIVTRARASHILPMTVRGQSFDNLLSAKTLLVHQIAHQYALDKSRNHQRNWRSISYLYKFIIENDLHMGPLFSRALTQICIIQPLMDNTWVDSRRLTWVCGIVARVEGEDVARRIEDRFWKWRGGLINHAQEKLVDNGGSGRAHVSTLRSLNLLR